MLDALIASGEPYPPWVTTPLRWHALTHAKPSTALRAAPVVRDAEGNWMSLTDLDALVELAGAVPYSIEAPEEPVTPTNGRRVAVIDGREVTWLLSQRRGLDATDALRDDLTAQRWERSKPVERIVPRTKDCPWEERAVIDDAARGFEGALWLSPWDAAHGTRVYWYKGRRPLGGATVETSWPAEVGLEAPRLTPNRRCTAPVDDAALDEARRFVSDAVERALFERLGPMDRHGAAVHVAAHDTGSPAGGAVPTVVGWLWLTGATEPGQLQVKVDAATITLPAEVLEGRAAPVWGRLWVRRSAGANDDARVVFLRKVVQWAWRKLLERLAERADGAAMLSRGDAGLDHLVWAAVEGLLTGGALKQLAKSRALPGTKTSVAQVMKCASEGRKLLVVPAGDPRLQRAFVVPEGDAPWMRRLARAELLEAPRVAQPVQRASSVVSPPPQPTPAPVSAPPRPAPAPVSAPPQPAPVSAPEPARPAPSGPRWKLGAQVLSTLTSMGLDGAALRAVEGHDGMRALRDAMVDYDPATRVARVWRGHPVVIALESGDPRRAARVLAIAVMGVVNRALAEVTDAHEEAFLDAMLDALDDDGSGGSRKRRR
ncbi:MAG: hypothetical protein R3A52_14315 [Polyangiales bacterium]